MNDNGSFERYVADRFDHEGSGRSIPDATHDELILRARRTRQRPGWLASLKEPPMRLANELAVGSPTIRVAAVMAATLLIALLIAGVGVAGSRLLAADASIVVDQSGGGDYTTIADAVADAKAGDEIVVMPGVYDGSVTITSDIIIRGQDKATTIVEVGRGCQVSPESATPRCPDGTPMVAENDIGLDSGAAARLDGTRPYAFRLLDSGAVVSDLTIRFVTAGVGLAVEGGAPVISGILHDDTVEGGSLLISGGSSATVRDSDLGDGWIQVSGRSPVTIADSTMFAIVANANGTMLEGAAATFRGNRTHGIFFSGPSVVQGNEVLVREREPGDSVGTSYASGIDVDTGEGWLISDNVVSGFTEDGLGAIRVPPGTAGTISGNTLTGNKVGIAVDADDAVVSGNVLAGGEIGIVVSGAARLEDNDVGGMSVAGISVGNRSTAELSGNRSCDNAQDLRVFRGGQPRLDDSNEICVMPALDG